MVRLVFRPYTQIRRTICTSVSLRASTRVSSGFTLPRHSSPSFGSRQVCSTQTLHRRSRSVGRACPSLSFRTRACHPGTRTRRNHWPTWSLTEKRGEIEIEDEGTQIVEKAVQLGTHTKERSSATIAAAIAWLVADCHQKRSCHRFEHDTVFSMPKPARP